MRTRITTALTLTAILTLTACGNDADNQEPEDTTPVAPTATNEPAETTRSPTQEPDSEEPTAEEPEEGDVPPMDYDTAPLPDGTFPPEQVPFGQPTYRAVMYMGHDAPLEWEATLTDFHCDVDTDQVIADFEESMLNPYQLRAGHKLCAATIRYENIGTVPGTYPEQPDGVIVGEALIEQTTNYELFVINDILMSEPLGGPFNPGITFEAQTLLEVPEGSEPTAVYLGPDDTQIVAHLLTK